jgi:putative ABC transport system permease protein
VLVAMLALLRSQLARPLGIAALRMAGQLAAVGFILEWVFALESLAAVTGVAGLMVLVAGREVAARQRGRIRPRVAWLLGAGAMALSSLAVAVALLTVVRPHPLWHPQYAIPLLGMLLGNTMSGVAITLERAATGLRERRPAIEARLLAGHRASDALADVRLDALRAGLIPLVNGLAVAGVVSLPGMMTGQILAGASPLEAVRYQILIFIGIGAGTGFGAVFAVSWLLKRAVDERERLRLDRIA